MRLVSNFISLISIQITTCWHKLRKICEYFNSYLSARNLCALCKYLGVLNSPDAGTPTYTDELLIMLRTMFVVALFDLVAALVCSRSSKMHERITKWRVEASEDILEMVHTYHEQRMMVQTSQSLEKVQFKSPALALWQ